MCPGLMVECHVWRGMSSAAPHFVASSGAKNQSCWSRVDMSAGIRSLPSSAPQIQIECLHAYLVSRETSRVARRGPPLGGTVPTLESKFRS